MAASRFPGRTGEPRRGGPDEFRAIDAAPPGTEGRGLLDDLGVFFAAAGGYTQIALLDVAAEHPAREPLEALSRVLWRAQHVCHALVDEGAAGACRLRPTDLRRVVLEAAGAARGLVPPGVALQPRTPAAPVSVRADDGRLVRTMLQLIRRSLQRVEGGGTVHVCAEGETPAHPGLAALVVSDDGPALSAEALRAACRLAQADPERDPRGSIELQRAAREVQRQGGSLEVAGDAVRMLMPLGTA